jgi:replicative DNA helicase Mcm
MTSTADESKSPDDITNLELTEEIKSAGIVNSFLCSFNSKSVIVQLNHKYVNKIIDLQVILEDWKLTNERFDNILKNKRVVDEDRIKLLRLLNHNANRITNHFSEQTLVHMHAGRRAKIERKEKAKATPPVEVIISQALRMHEGNIRVKGMISGSSAKVEKMYTLIGLRCGECDTINELVNYRDSRPRFAYEVPRIDLNKVKCVQGCHSFKHEPYEEVISALRIELQDTETYNDLERLQIVLLGNCTKNVSIGEQVIITGSIQKVRMRDKLLPYAFAGLEPTNVNAIEYVNKRESIELTEIEEKEMREFVKKNKGRELDALSELFAPSIIGYKHVKKGLLMCAVNSGKDSVERRLRINALLVGETGLDKTGLLIHSTRLVGLNSRFASAVNSTVRSLIGVVDKDVDTSGILRLGPIPSANGAICAIDEIGRMSYEDQGFLLTALQHGTIYFGRHGFNTTLNASATFILSANPTGSSGEWRDKERINFNEIPILGPLRDRVDLIFVFRTDRSIGHVVEYALKKAEMTENYDAILKKENENYEFLMRYILFCKRFNPKFSREARIMIVQYYASIMSSSDNNNQSSPRLLETLNNLCRVVARLKQKDTIDVEDAKEVIQFYAVQLVQHLSQIVAIPSDPRDLAVEEINNILKDSKFKHEFIELLKAACQRNQWVSQYIGFDNEGKRDWSVGSNRRVRQVRDRFTKGANNDKIRILSISPLVLAWRESYTGGDKDALNYTNDGDSGCSSNQESEGEQQQQQAEFVIDTIDTIDSDKDGIASNEAATDRITATDFSPISEERQTSIMSNMSIKVNTSENSEISHSSHKKKDLTNSGDNTTDQLTKCQEKSTPIPQNSEKETTPNENLGGSEGQKVRNESEEELTKSKDYPAYISSQEEIFSIHSDKDTIAISSNVSESNHGPKLAPYVSRLYPGSDLFKCEYCSVKQDRWGMAEHSHSEKSKKRGK